MVIVRRLGEGSFISHAAPLDVIGSGAIDERCWWRATGSGHVLEVLPAYREDTLRISDLPAGTRVAFHHEAGQTFEVDPRENVRTREQVVHLDGDPRNNDIDNLRIVRCSCYRDDVRDPNCRVHGTSSSTVGRNSARSRPTVGLRWED